MNWRTQSAQSREQIGDPTMAEGILDRPVALRSLIMQEH
jgi:hypothetical protein